MNAAPALAPAHGFLRITAPAARFAAPRRYPFAAGIVLLHVLVFWALLQAPAVRQRLAAAEPVAVRLIATAPAEAPAPAAAAARSAPPAPPRIQRDAPLPAPAAPPLSRQRAEAPAAEPTPAAAVSTGLPAVAEAPPAPPAPVVVAAAPPAPEPPPAAAPAAPKQIPASAVQYLNRVLPVYSPASIRAREAGRVVARVLIDEAGQPRTVQVQQSSHFVRLDDACAAAVRQSRFKPYTDNGQPTAGWALVPCDFEL